MVNIKNIDNSIKATIIDEDTSIKATIITSFGKATTIKEGVVRLATEQEARTGILNNNVVINPYTLKCVLSNIENNIDNIETTINNYGDIVTYNASDFASASQGELAESALQGIQINGADLSVSDSKVNIPMASTNDLGVVKIHREYGVAIMQTGELCTYRAQPNQITAKTNNYLPIVPSNIDLAVKVGVTTNTISLSSAEQTAAQTWLGINTSNFATAAQGQKADTALQPNDNISLLNNNAGFITNAVNDLTNYYLKSETYTKLEVQQLIASIPQFSVEVVQSLPVTGERMVLYLVPKQGESPDVYNEYIWVEDEEEFELLGSTAVDLTGYAKESWVLNQGYITGITSSDVTTALGYTPYNSTNPNGYITSSALTGYATETYVDTGLATKQNTLVSGTNIKTVNNESLLGSGNINIQSSNTAYGTSDTAGNVAQKEVSIPSITELNVGQILYIKPSASATVANLTIKLNDFEAYPIRYNNGAITTTTDDLVWSQNFVSQFIFDGTYWQFAGHGYDKDTTYTINYSIDAGGYTAGIGNYAISRNSLCMQKPDMTWEKVTNPDATYSTAANKTVNTHGFLLNQIRYYNYTVNIADGSKTSTNTMYEKAASLDFRYSTNCGDNTGFTSGDYVYFVGTIGVDGLFYLDTTQWWTNTLPSTNDGKLYIQLGKYISGTNIALYDQHPAYYHDGTRICVYQSASNKQDTLVSGTNIKTINNQSLLGSGNITIGGGGGGAVDSVNGYTGTVVLTASDVGALADTVTIPTKTSDLTNDSGFITNAVNNLTNYYLKTDTYTKTEVQQLIASIPQFSVEVVQSLPVTGERMVLYLVPKQGEAPDVYDEYIWVEDEEEFELLGSTAVDLTGYATETWVGQQGYITGITSSDVTTALGYTPYNSTNPSGYITSADLPTVNNATITFTQGGTTKGTITLNQSSNQTIALDAGGSGGGTWGSITGTLSDQTDLQNALNAKLNVSDVTEYTAAEVETLWGSI